MITYAIVGATALVAGVALGMASVINVLLWRQEALKGGQEQVSLIP